MYSGTWAIVWVFREPTQELSQQPCAEALLPAGNSQIRLLSSGHSHFRNEIIPQAAGHDRTWQSHEEEGLCVLSPANTACGTMTAPKEMPNVARPGNTHCMGY